MPETFGKTDIGVTKPQKFNDYQYACKFTSGSAGSLASISLYVDYGFGDVKCAIFDSGFNKLTNGETEEIHNPTNGAFTAFNFGASKPSVEASTVYWLAWWSSGDMYYARDMGGTEQFQLDAKTYNTWDDPLVPDGYEDNEYSIYATYEEAPPAKKTLVQAALI